VLFANVTEAANNSFNLSIVDIPAFQNLLKVMGMFPLIKEQVTMIEFV